jgi:hypothetical protein
MKLLELQRTMARAVMQPLTRSEHMQKRAPNGERMAKHSARFIKPNDRLSSFERLEIYNRQYWWRVLASLAEDFPGLQAVLGQARFEALSKAYLMACPSRSFTLRNLGKGLEAWLRKNPRWAGSRLAVAIDMVRLEWADIEAFDGRAEEPFRAEQATAGGRGLKLRVQPYVRLLNLRYPVDSLVLDIKSLNDDTEFSSNAFHERKKKERVRTVARLKAADIYLAVHRVDNSVYFRRLERDEFRLLQSIQSGKTLEQALAACFGKHRRQSEPDLAQITRWFQNWASLGWFCAAN